MSEIRFYRKVQKELKSLSKQDARRVVQEIARLKFPLPKFLDINKLVNTSNFYRLRVGKTRAIFEVLEQGAVIMIRKIGYRGNVYRL
ncbi:MAG: type II toxin-antitoxin system RelE/ParE family toxin [Patescibacteria group bacterium]